MTLRMTAANIVFAFVALAMATQVVADSSGNQAIAADIGRAEILIQMNAKVDEIKHESSEERQAETALQLLILIENNKEIVDDSLISKLISLIGDKDSAVRRRIAMSFAFIGPRASVAIPVLEKALYDTECIQQSQSSVYALTEALKRLGRTVNESPDCRGRSKSNEAH